MVLALAGDSTMTRERAMISLRLGTRRSGRNGYASQNTRRTTVPQAVIENGDEEQQKQPKPGAPSPAARRLAAGRGAGPRIWMLTASGGRVHSPGESPGAE